ncbi:MAG TPA: hypothetical protein ENN76_00920 [Euryarchaeota archaeon]|nr:hypothetical protein [Euryarchaeota archaeon]
MNGLVMDTHELLILYNAIHEQTSGEVVIHFPFYDTDLFRYDMYKDEIRYIVPSWRFQKAKDSFTNGMSPFMSQDAPRWVDMKDSFMKAGVLPYQNFHDVKLSLEKVLNETDDRSLHPKNPVLALDTNILYNRFVSRSMDFIGANRKVGRGDFKYVISTLVREELDSQIVKKYYPQSISEMEKRYNRGEIAKEFSNGSARNNRKAKDAIVEMRHVIRDLGASIADFREERPKDKEVMDRAIVKSYLDFQNDTGTRVILLTCDQDMAFHASNAGLPSIVISIPYHVPNHLRMNPKRWARVLHSLAIGYGIIEIRGVATLYSEWRGKDHNSYEREEVKVYIEDKKMYDKVARWLKLSLQMM